MAMMADSLSVTSRKRLADRDVFSAFWPHSPALVVISLSHTGGCKMNVFTVVLSRLSNVDFSQTRPKIEGEAVSAGCLLLLLLFWLVCFVFDCLFVLFFRLCPSTPIDRYVARCVSSCSFTSTSHM